MGISPDMANFALAMTTDPEVAAAMTDILFALDGGIDEDARVPYPSSWVRRAMGRGEEIAVVAARGCGDADLQREIFESSGDTSLERAVARSRWLAPENGEHFLRLAKARGDRKQIAALSLWGDSSVKSRLDALFGFLREVEYGAVKAGRDADRGVGHYFFQVIKHDGFDADGLGELLERAGDAGFWGIFALILEAHYGRSLDLSALGARDVDVAERIDQEHKASILSAVLTGVLRSSGSTRPIGEAMFEYFSCCVEGEVVGAGVVGANRVIFDDAAFARVLQERRWHGVIREHAVTDAQFETLVHSVDGITRYSLIEKIEGSERRGQLVIEALSGGRRCLVLPQFGKVLSSIRSDDKESLEKLLSLADLGTLAYYLTGGLSSWYQREGDLAWLLPSVEGMYETIETIKASDSADHLWRRIAENTSGDDIVALGDERTKILLDRLPYVAARFVERRVGGVVRQYVWDRLLGSGIDIGRSLLLFESHPELSLDDVCGVLFGLARSETLACGD